MARAKKRSLLLPSLFLLCFVLLVCSLFHTGSMVVYTSVNELDDLRKTLKEPATAHGSTLTEENRDEKMRGQSIHPPSPYRFRIFVFTYARPEGLAVTLRSVLAADYSKAGNSGVDLEVFVDYRRNQSSEMKSLQDRTMKMLNDVVWPHGRFRVHRRCVNAGLRHSIMEAWYPTNDREVAAFFEDDVKLSPLWFSWTHDTLTHYAPIENGAIQTDPHFVGISLFRPVFDELSAREVPVHNDHSPFLLQQPCSWGAVYLPAQWRAFRSFFDDVKEKDLLVTLPDGQRPPSSNRWDYATSWKKYLIYYMYEHGQYMLYPNLPQRLVFSTSRLLQGEHRTPQRKYFVLPLVQKKNLSDASIARSVITFPKKEKLKVFDILFNKTAGIQKLPHYNKF